MGESVRLEDHPASDRPLTRIAQVIVVLGALVVAVIIVARKDLSANAEPGFNALSYLDAQVGSQESNKDVRCWSSTCKLQMFLTGAQIEPEAVAVRIQSQMDLIQSIWSEARTERLSSTFIGAGAVRSVLERRFPHHRDAQTVKFVLGKDVDPINVLSSALQDYSDTVEPWRLIQNWASRHTDAEGHVTLKPQFDEEALHVLYDFLHAYDLAILEHARQIARAKKLASIDAIAMSEAFRLESKLQR